jgi:hypothetical protein
VRALLWPLFARSACDQASTMVKGTTGEGAVHASDRLVGLGSDSHCVSGTTSDGVALASVRSVVVGSGSHRLRPISIK